MRFDELDFNFLEKCFSMYTFKNGIEYFNIGAVVRAFEDGKKIFGFVQGSQVQPYYVELYFSDDGYLKSNCTCPVKHDCKHAAALGIYYVKNKTSVVDVSRTYDVIKLSEHAKFLDVIDVLLHIQPELADGFNLAFRILNKDWKEVKKYFNKQIQVLVEKANVLFEKNIQFSYLELRELFNVVDYLVKNRQYDFATDLLVDVLENLAVEIQVVYSGLVHMFYDVFDYIFTSIYKLFSNLKSYQRAVVVGRLLLIAQSKLTSDEVYQVIGERIVEFVTYDVSKLQNSSKKGNEALRDGSTLNTEYQILASKLLSELLRSKALSSTRSKPDEDIKIENVEHAYEILRRIRRKLRGYRERRIKVIKPVNIPDDFEEPYFELLDYLDKNDPDFRFDYEEAFDAYFVSDLDFDSKQSELALELMKKHGFFETFISDIFNKTEGLIIVAKLLVAHGYVSKALDYVLRSKSLSEEVGFEFSAIAHNEGLEEEAVKLFIDGVKAVADDIPRHFNYEDIVKEDLVNFVVERLSNRDFSRLINYMKNALNNDPEFYYVVSLILSAYLRLESKDKNIVSKICALLEPYVVILNSKHLKSIISGLSKVDEKHAFDLCSSWIGLKLPQHGTKDEIEDVLREVKNAIPEDSWVKLRSRLLAEYGNSEKLRKILKGLN